MIKKLLALNGIAIIGAVLYHAAGWGFISMFWWTDRFLPVTVPNFSLKGSFSYFGLRFIEQIIIIAIPAFLFVSGYFIVFASGKESAPKWKWIFTRIKYLVIPYLIWSTILICMNVFFGESYQPGQIVNMILTGKAIEAFYFIPLIIQLYLLSPILTRAVKAKPFLMLSISFILMILVHLGQYASMLGISYIGKSFLSLFTHAWLFPGNLFWFVFGIYIGFFYASIQEKLVRFRLLFLTISLVLIPVGIWEWEKLLALSGRDWYPSRESIVDNLFSIFFLLTFITYSLGPIIKLKWLNYLGSKSFGIYLSHTLFLTLIAKIIYNLIPQILKYQIIFQPILIFGAIIGPVLLIEILKRSPLRKIYGYVFG
ncbi:MAG: acyltransferase family protein [Anaerolineaceae bacterium]